MRENVRWEVRNFDGQTILEWFLLIKRGVYAPNSGAKHTESYEQWTLGGWAGGS